jgi:hypothetical protein
LEADISGAKLLAIIAARPAERERFLDFIYNGNHLFASKIDGHSAEGADGLTVRYQPSNLFANFLAAMRAGEREITGTSVMGRAPPGKSASVDLIERPADFPDHGLL